MTTWYQSIKSYEEYNGGIAFIPIIGKSVIKAGIKHRKKISFSRSSSEDDDDDYEGGKMDLLGSTSSENEKMDLLSNDTSEEEKMDLLESTSSEEEKTGGSDFFVRYSNVLEKV